MNFEAPLPVNKPLHFFSEKGARFLIVGGLTFVIYYTILWMTFSSFHWSYKLAIAVSYVFAVAFHFFSNRNLTFKVHGAGLLLQLFRYCLVAILNYFVQVFVVFLTYEVLGMHFYLSTFFGIAATMVLGFILMNRWVFPHAPTPEDTARNKNIKIES